MQDAKPNAAGRNSAGRNSAEQNTAEQNTAEQKLAEQNTAGQNTAEQKLAEQNTPEQNTDGRKLAKQIASLIDASPTPYHVVDSAEKLLTAAGGRNPANIREATTPGLWYTTDGGALTAWCIGEHHKARTGLRLIGAHTDSPNLRLKPQPDRDYLGYRRISVDTYGSPLLNSWLDRDLGIAGRFAVHGDRGRVSTKLVQINKPLLRIPQLAIHLDRNVNENGLTLNRQMHMSPIWGIKPANGDHTPAPSSKSTSEQDFQAPGRSQGSSPESQGGQGGQGGQDRQGRQGRLPSPTAACAAESELVNAVAIEADIDPDTVIGHELMAFDLTPACLVGHEQSLLSSSRLDNQLSSFLAVKALIEASEMPSGLGDRIPVVCLFDHEEVGSVSATGAGSPRLDHLFDMLSTGFDASADDINATRADSFFLSADGAHATHPNYPERHDLEHLVMLNRGPVLKTNVNRRYATDIVTGAIFQLACKRAGVPVQQFVSRSDMLCGSTIGPTISGRFGIHAVDAGCPQLAMHSIRELCGVQDVIWFYAALQQFFLD